MKAIVDTNVLAAGFGTRGLCSDLIREVLENHELVSSPGILKELRRILIEKFKVPEQVAQDIVEFVSAASLMSEADTRSSYPIGDKDDIPHLSAAENAHCDVFVTGDKELWAAQTTSGMRILSPRDFWKTISAPQESGTDAGKPRRTPQATDPGVIHSQPLSSDE